MKIFEAILMILLTGFFTSGNMTEREQFTKLPTGIQDNTSEYFSPLDQFETLDREGVWVDGEQVEALLKSYGVYDPIMAFNENNESIYTDVKICVEMVGDKKVAILLIEKGHNAIYVMFSKCDNQWIADGFASQSERFRPEYRIEKTSDGMKYWLVVKHEANHGTGTALYDEIWYRPDGTIAAEYPLEGDALCFPKQMPLGRAGVHYIANPDFDGKSKIHLAYSVCFTYDYESDFGEAGFKNVFQSEYRPSIRDYWAYDLTTQKLEFLSSHPVLPEHLSEIEHKVSDEYGVVKGYIDFYDSRLGYKKITSLAEWQDFIELR
ncbi:hypothetical protein [Fusibacter ferrireducens]|uniref:YARHG domain-containing protein n=1 Tax=Fusibacter ferrireducens TaxID=2785058 RepID=A0ABR9ZUC4_9FIRM|nr:hypothetical protein [Fusibacter ferrireducens]MBF4693753.1 hypothetical protein [Fusibacter ferrireducens]